MKTMEDFSEKLGRISQTQEEQALEINQNTEAREGFKKVKAEVGTLASTMNVVLTFVFENKPVIPEIQTYVAELSKRIEKLENEKLTQPAQLTHSIAVINGKYNSKTWDEQLTTLKTNPNLM